MQLRQIRIVHFNMFGLYTASQYECYLKYWNHYASYHPLTYDTWNENNTSLLKIKNMYESKKLCDSSKEMLQNRTILEAILKTKRPYSADDRKERDLSKKKRMIEKKGRKNQIHTIT